MELKLLDSRIEPPKQGSSLAAGYDLQACVDKELHIAPGATERIRTGVSLNMKDTIENGLLLCGLILPRSGLGCKGIKPNNAPGLIDADYHGEIIVCLKNDSEDFAVIKPLDRIAQLVFMLSLHPEIKIVTEFSSGSDRGAKGFGSTGQ